MGRWRLPGCCGESSDNGLTGRERSETGNGGSVCSHSSHSRQCGPLETPGCCGESSDHGLTGRERSETGNGGSVRSHSSHSRQCGPLETPGVLR